MVIFLINVGPEVYLNLRLNNNLLAPTKSKDMLLADIVKVLEKHYNSKPLEITQSFFFFQKEWHPVFAF